MRIGFRNTRRFDRIKMDGEVPLSGYEPQLESEKRVLNGVEAATYGNARGIPCSRGTLSPRIHCVTDLSKRHRCGCPGHGSGLPKVMVGSGKDQCENVPILAVVEESERPEISVACVRTCQPARQGDRIFRRSQQSGGEKDASIHQSKCGMVGDKQEGDRELQGQVDDISGLTVVARCLSLFSGERPKARAYLYAGKRLLPRVILQPESHESRFTVGLSRPTLSLWMEGGARSRHRSPGRGPRVG